MVIMALFPKSGLQSGAPIRGDLGPQYPATRDRNTRQSGAQYMEIKRPIHDNKGPAIHGNQGPYTW